jgi:hypothetical protein
MQRPTLAMSAARSGGGGAWHAPGNAGDRDSRHPSASNANGSPLPTRGDLAASWQRRDRQTACAQRPKWCPAETEQFAEAPRRQCDVDAERAQRRQGRRERDESALLLRPFEHAPHRLLAVAILAEPQAICGGVDDGIRMMAAQRSQHPRFAGCDRQQRQPGVVRQHFSRGNVRQQARPEGPRIRDRAVHHRREAFAAPDHRLATVPRADGEPRAAEPVVAEAPILLAVGAAPGQRCHRSCHRRRWLEAAAQQPIVPGADDAAHAASRRPAPWRSSRRASAIACADRARSPRTAA